VYMYTFMEMPLENKQYIIAEDVLSKKVLKLLEPYARLLATDKSSYNVWPNEMTFNKTAVECFTCDVLGKDRIEIIDELYSNTALPCYNKTWLKGADIAVQKIPAGGQIPKHTDHCIFSLTVFLSSITGGEFVWWDHTDNQHTVTPKYNTGIISCADTYSRGLAHEVLPVQDGVRYTAQIFVFDKTKSSTNETKSVIWEIEK
jgi:hypothetical protein